MRMFRPNKEWYELIDKILSLKFYKTIDSLISDVSLNEKVTDVSINDIIDYLICDHSIKVFGVLQEQTNNPSKHDMMIINTATKYLNNKNEYFHTTRSGDSYLIKIIDYYKNRKV